MITGVSVNDRSMIHGPRGIDRVTVVARSIVTRAVVAVIPRTSANEDPVYEVVRAVVASRRAGIGIIAIVAIGANGGGANADRDRANSDAYANANLRAGVGGGEEECEGSQQNCILDVAHGLSRFRSRLMLPIPGPAELAG